MTDFKNSNLGKAYYVDKDKAQEGVWRSIDIGSDKSIRVKLASSDGRLNKRYQRMILQRTKPYQRALLSNRDSSEMRAKTDIIAVECFAAAVLLDWEGVEDADGKPIPYTKEVGAEFLQEFPTLATELEELARDNTIFKGATQDDLDAVAGN